MPPRHASPFFLLSRYDVDKAPPLHCRSATAVVLGATDHDGDSTERRALKAMRDPSAVLAELDAARCLDSKFLERTSCSSREQERRRC